jgi:hypothetical protein
MVRRTNVLLLFKDLMMKTRSSVVRSGMVRRRRM